MSSKNTAASRRLSYREKDVDKTLDKHATRIRRLEKIALIGIGYGLAEGGNLAETIVQFI